MAPREVGRHAPVQHGVYGGVMGYTGRSEGVTGGGASKRPPRLLDEVRRVLRLKHDSLRREQAYFARAGQRGQGQTYAQGRGGVEPA